MFILSELAEKNMSNQEKIMSIFYTLEDHRLYNQMMLHKLYGKEPDFGLRADNTITARLNNITKME